MLTVACPNISAAVLPLLARQLTAFGCVVTFDTPASGIVQCLAGRLTFTHSPDTKVFSVTITDDAGHFPRALLIGGIKQMIAEAHEAVMRQQQASAASAA